jgi:hypothetical protein
MIGVLPLLVHWTRNLGRQACWVACLCIYGLDASPRRKIRLIEGNAKCRHLKNFTHVFLRPRT